MLDQITSVSFE